MYGEAPSPTHSSSDENEWDTGSHTWDEDNFYFGQSDGEDDFMNNDDEIFLSANQVDDSEKILTEVMQLMQSYNVEVNNAEEFAVDMQERAENAVEEDNTMDEEEHSNNDALEETKERDADINENNNAYDEENVNTVDNEQQNISVENVTNDNVVEQMTETTTESRYNLRLNRKRNFSKRVQFFAKQHKKHGVRAMLHEIYKQTVNVMFTQMQARTGIKKHGQRTIAVMFKEYVQ